MVIAQQNIANTLLHYFFSKKAVFKQFFKQQKYCTIAIFFQMVVAIVFAIVLGFFGGIFLTFFLIQSFINFVFDKLKVLIKFVSFSFMTYDRYLLILGVIFGQDSTVLKNSTTYSQIWAKFCRYFYCKQFDYCNTFLVKVMHNYYCNTFLSNYFYCYCNTFIWSITMLCCTYYTIVMSYLEQPYT